MIWPCKDTAVSMKSDVHCHPPSSSARVPGQGTRWSCVLLNAVHPQFLLCWRQSNKTGVIPALPFHTTSDSFHITSDFSYNIRFSAHLPHTFSLQLTVHTEQKVKATPQQSGFSRSPFPRLRHLCESHWAAVRTLSIPLSTTHSNTVTPQVWICFGAEFKVFFRLSLWHPDRSYGYHYGKTEVEPLSIEHNIKQSRNNVPF